MPSPQDQMTAFLMSFLKDKKAITENVLKNLSQANTIRRGLENLLEQLEDEDKEMDFRKVALALVKSMRSLSASAEQNGVLALLYVDGSNFDTDAALMLGRLGRGKEALRQMFENKLRGKG